VKVVRILLLPVFLSSLLFAQSADSVIRNVRIKYNSVKNISADFIRIKNGRAKDELKGRMFFSGEKVKIILPAGEIVIIKDTVWNYNKKLRQLVISSNEGGEFFFSPQKFSLNFLKNFRAKMVKKENLFKIKFTPLRNNSDLEEIKLTVDKSFLIRSILTKGQTFGIFKIVFKNYKLNVKLKRDFFKLKVPNNCRVIDLR